MKKKQPTISFYFLKNFSSSCSRELIFFFIFASEERLIFDDLNKEVVGGLFFNQNLLFCLLERI